MKEVLIDSPPALDSDQERIADLHSLFNVLNVVTSSLAIVRLAAGEQAAKIDAARAEVEGIVAALRENGSLPDLPDRLRALEKRIVGEVRSLLPGMDEGEDKRDVAESLENLESIFSVLSVRVRELEIRAQDPDVWIETSAAEFRNLFEEVFYAIEKNSRGRYRIFFNLARKRPDDYYIDLKVESEREGGDLRIPLRLVDVLRDLTANARKYTEPGGKVALAVFEDEEAIRCVIEDSGAGIPEDELDRVVEFGYRASNVAERPTMGGGFGLTKAAWLVCRWGGSLAIASEENRGTTIRIAVPVAVESSVG